MSQIQAVNPASFTTHAISAIKHDFHTHPLMEMDRLHDLAEYLMPRRLCRFVAPDLKQDDPFTQHETLDGISLADLFRTIEPPRSSIALYNVQEHPDYRRFLDEAIDSVRHLVEREQPGIFGVAGFIFIAAPPGVTPFHIDRENNFWLQIRGQKIISVFDHTDRDVVSGRDVDEFVVHHDLHNVRLRDSFANRAQNSVTKPGDGIYFPSTTPHMTQTTEEWVTPGNGVSVSIGVVFYTEHTRSVAQVHQCNVMMRKLGLEPQPPGTSRLRDALEGRAGHGLAKLRARLRGYEPPTGSC